MRITFLGHQGWQIENQGRSFLLDPILEEVGNGAQRMPIWPRRRLDLARLRPLDAVIISHEHADHFSLDTLLALPRHCSILLSDLSSWAMHSAIAELGFPVQRFTALRPFVINAVTVTALPGLYNTLEPDTPALLMQDASGASFFTGIDTVPHPDVLGWLALHCPVRTLDSLTNNFLEPRQDLLRNPRAHERSRALLASQALEFVRQFEPRRVVLSGQGWSFQGAKQHLNHSYFSVDNAWLARAAAELAPQVQWFEGEPGMRFTLRGMELSVDASPLVEAGVRTNREFRPDALSRTEPFEPWSGLEQLATERWAAVRSFIVADFGQALNAHAPRLMEALYDLKTRDIGAFSPSFGLSVRNGTARWMFELDFGHLLMREVRRGEKPPAVGIEVWASDLELLIGAAEEAFTVYESAVQRWSHVPASIDESLLIESLLGFTPRFRPREFLAFYRTQLASRQAERSLVAAVTPEDIAQ